MESAQNNTSPTLPALLADSLRLARRHAACWRYVRVWVKEEEHLNRSLSKIAIRPASIAEGRDPLSKSPFLSDDSLREALNVQSVTGLV